MKKIGLIILSVFVLASCDLSKYKLVKDYDLETRFEKTKGTETATYSEVMAFYEELDASSTLISLREFGPTDSGNPLHLVVYDPTGDFDGEELPEDRPVLFINNGIHPGESDGIDASMMLFRDLAGDSIATPKNVIVAAIPIYNIGGALNRNTGTRANQNGPKEYGFRGNARNYDLNRDFIKADTKNAQSFYEIYHYLNPDVFIDTHVSNGADYQYYLTHLFTQHDKLGGSLGKYLDEEFMPALEDSLKVKEWEITPYVNSFGSKPEEGFSQFMDHPRYSTGYTTLWNTLGMMIETHMLKPYKERVEGTYEILLSMIRITEAESSKIKDLRNRTSRDYLTSRRYPIAFEADEENPSKREFLGYESAEETSAVTGRNQLKYDRNKPFSKEIDYFNNFTVSKEIEVPRAYIIPKGWWQVIERLKLNNIKMEPLAQDTIMTVEAYTIENYETSRSAYEGHYPHTQVEVSTTTQRRTFQKGDFLVSTFQPGIRYLLETLEPEASDSFFKWNFFDTVLQRKEHFSSYVFDDEAAQMLEENDSLREAFNEKKRTDSEFANSSYAQLQFLYEQSNHNEEAYLSYPIFRLPR